MRIVIIGAGHAGGTAAALLRQYGFDGEIILIGEESVEPYQRPPLSKAFLKGSSDEEDLKLKSDNYYLENKIELCLGTCVERIDREAKTIHYGDGESCSYDKLIIATGARPRPLPIAENILGIYSLRNIEDAKSIRESIKPGKTLAVIGGGYIGLEIAASARAIGADVVVIEREDRVLARVASEPLSKFFESYHISKGVEFITDASVSAVKTKKNGKKVAAVKLESGRVIQCDFCVVGIGAIVCADIAIDAGLDCEQGILVDENSQTSDPSIYAIGDVTLRPLPLYENCLRRLESVGNALEQAKQAACHILGRPHPPQEVPWFWSDQYDIKLQIAGMPIGVDNILIRGSISEAKFAVFHLKGTIIKAVEAVNSPAEFMMGRKLIGAGKAVNREILQNPAISMRDVCE